jgi:hypothetical protein
VLYSLCVFTVLWVGLLLFLLGIVFVDGAGRCLLRPVNSKIKLFTIIKFTSNYVTKIECIWVKGVGFMNSWLELRIPNDGNWNYKTRSQHLLAWPCDE